MIERKTFLNKSSSTPVFVSIFLSQKEYIMNKYKIPEKNHPHPSLVFAFADTNDEQSPELLKSEEGYLSVIKAGCWMTSPSVLQMASDKIE